MYYIPYYIKMSKNNLYDKHKRICTLPPAAIWHRIIITVDYIIVNTNNKQFE